MIGYEHPVVTERAVAAQNRHREINGVARTYYCGAYWRNGFHEDGVVSAIDALRHFEEDLGGQGHEYPEQRCLGGAGSGLRDARRWPAFAGRTTLALPASRSTRRCANSSPSAPASRPADRSAS